MKEKDGGGRSGERVREEEIYNAVIVLQVQERNSSDGEGRLHLMHGIRRRKDHFMILTPSFVFGSAIMLRHANPNPLFYKCSNLPTLHLYSHWPHAHLLEEIVSGLLCPMHE